MSKKKHQYQVWINQCRFIQVDVDATSDNEAKEKALDLFKTYIWKNSFTLVDETTRVTGVQNVTKSWEGINT